MDRVRVRKRIVRTLLVVLSVPAVLWGLVVWTDNFGTVQPGRTYRSGQMSGDHIRRAIDSHGIRTVLNLRGANPETAWYRDERQATTAAGATQVDVALSSCEWMSRAQLRALVRLLDTCEYPLLIHCQYGAERTGLVSSIAELLRPGSTLRQAEGQFTIRHLFLPVKDGKMMLAHLAQYESWLKSRGGEHTPARFRQWAADGYTPHWPTREMWPYDPKPLVVITRPTTALAGSDHATSRR